MPERTGGMGENQARRMAHYAASRAAGSERRSFFQPAQPALPWRSATVIAFDV
jgi:hypothetical protein